MNLQARVTDQLAKNWLYGVLKCALSPCSKSSTYRIYTRDTVLMDSVVFYQPQSATVPNFKDRLVRLSATLPRNDAGSVLLQNGDQNASWRAQNVIKCLTATNRYRGGQPRLGQQACGDDLLRNQGECRRLPSRPI
jgi:hypothetical protein